ADAAVLEGGAARLAALLEAAGAEREAALARERELDALRVRMHDSLSRAAELGDALPLRLEHSVGDELHGMFERAFATRGGARQALAARLEKWPQDQDIVLITEAWREEAVEEIERWALETRTGLRRRIGSAAFKAAQIDSFALELDYLKRESK